MQLFSTTHPAIVLFVSCLYLYPFAGNGQMVSSDHRIMSPDRAVIADDSGRTAAVNYYRLGVQYKDGKGVPMDYAKAFSYFSRAAALGDAQSIYATGYMQYKGLGTNQDYGITPIRWRHLFC